jgi:hypothetical protein
LPNSSGGFWGKIHSLIELMGNKRLIAANSTNHSIQMLLNQASSIKFIELLCKLMMAA